MKFGGFSLALGAGAALALLLAGTSMESTAGATPDVDSDTVYNLRDNCVDVANPLSIQETQVDSDRDGFGNECDGDFTGPGGVRNGEVNVQDFGSFLSAYNQGYNAGSPDAGWNADTDMNSNGETNVQDYGLFLAQFGLGQPGPSGLRCASTVNGSDNLTGRKPCEYIRTFRVKCTGVPPQTEPAGVIKSNSTGVDFRFVQSSAIVDYSAIAGRDGGHCGGGT